MVMGLMDSCLFMMINTGILPEKDLFGNIYNRIVFSGDEELWSYTIFQNRADMKQVYQKRVGQLENATVK